MSIGLMFVEYPESLFNTLYSCSRLNEVWLTLLGGVLNISASFICREGVGSNYGNMLSPRQPYLSVYKRA